MHSLGLKQAQDVICVTGDNSSGQLGDNTNNSSSVFLCTVGQIISSIDEFDADVKCSISPNPFSQFTIINYELQTAGRVRIDIFNSLGEKITTLVDEFQEAGKHNYELGITNYELSAGMYYYRIQIGEKNESGKLMLIR